MNVSQANRNALTSRLGWFDYGILAIIALMPLHAFLSVYAGHLFGHQQLWQAWKEVVIILLGIAAIASPERRQRIASLFTHPATYFVGLFFIVALVVTTLNGGLGSTSFWFGAKTDLEFLVLFLLAQLTRPAAYRALPKVLLGGLLLVAGFGALQASVLPKDFLVRFGYGPDTIEPYRLVDPAVPGIRIISTLGGPNQLGSYLLLPLMICLFYIWKRKWFLAPLAAVGIITLWHTFSRSAEVGFVIAILALVFLMLPRRGRWLVIGTGIISFATLWVVTTKSIGKTQLQYYLLHGRVSQQELGGSDKQRIQALQDGFDAALHTPWGSGLGSAGPASEHAKNLIISENYYLQLGIETGLLGAVIFVALCVALAMELSGRRELTLAIPALAALIGLIATNLFLHTWTDSTTALVTWGSLGIILAAPLQPGKRRLLGTSVNDLTEDDALTAITSYVKSGQAHHVVTVNPEFIMTARNNTEFRQVLGNADLAVADGMGLVVLANLVAKPIRTRVAGADLVVTIAQKAAQKGWRIFLLGAGDGVAAQAGQQLAQRFPGLKIAGTYPGTPNVAEEAEICRLIKTAKPDILFVAFGSPNQDLWIARTRERLQIPVAMGIGGTLDFIAGATKRAPRWMQATGLEWFYRLIKEPHKRWRRVLALPKFAILSLAERFHLISS